MHLILLCHAATRAMREGAFLGADDPVDAGGMAKARALKMGAHDCVTSPALAARQTAEALGIAATTHDALRDIDHGDWAGRSFEQAHAANSDAFGRWMNDPASGAPGGETLSAVRDRIAVWLGEHSAGQGTLIAITHPMVIRAAIAAAIDMPIGPTLRIDIAPLSAVRLSWNRVWRLQGITS